MYINCTDYEYEHIYRMNTLKDYSDYAQRDIERCLETIEKLKKYQLGIYEQVQKVLNTPIKKYVVIERRKNYSSNRVEYFVHLDHRPITAEEKVKGNKIYGNHEFNKMFKGSERHLAFAYADELSKSHRAEIEKKGYWGKY